MWKISGRDRSRQDLGRAVRAPAGSRRTSAGSERAPAASASEQDRRASRRTRRRPRPGTFAAAARWITGASTVAGKPVKLATSTYAGESGAERRRRNDAPQARGRRRRPRSTARSVRRPRRSGRHGLLSTCPTAAPAAAASTSPTPPQSRPRAERRVARSRRAASDRTGQQDAGHDSSIARRRRSRRPVASVAPGTTSRAARSSIALHHWAHVVASGRRRLDRGAAEQGALDDGPSLQRGPVSASRSRSRPTGTTARCSLWAARTGSAGSPSRSSARGAGIAARSGSIRRARQRAVELAVRSGPSGPSVRQSRQASVEAPAPAF